MALDFTQVDDSGRNFGPNVAIKALMFVELHDHFKAGGPYLDRLRDYYRDAFFYNDVLGALRLELVSLRDKLQVPAQVRIVERMIEVVELGISSGSDVEAIAD